MLLLLCLWAVHTCHPCASGVCAEALGSEGPRCSRGTVCAAGAPPWSPVTKAQALTPSALLHGGARSCTTSSKCSLLSLHNLCRTCQAPPFPVCLQQCQGLISLWLCACGTHWPEDGERNKSDGNLLCGCGASVTWVRVVTS